MLAAGATSARAMRGHVSSEWWDSGAKAPKEKPELESKVENRFVRQAKKRGWKTRKLNGLGNRDWHDQLVLAPNTICLIEFKRPGNEYYKETTLSPGQETHHEEVAALGLGSVSLVTSSAEEALQFVERLVCRNLHLTNTKKKP